MCFMLNNLWCKMFEIWAKEKDGMLLQCTLCVYMGLQIVCIAYYV